MRVPIILSSHRDIETLQLNANEVVRIAADWFASNSFFLNSGKTKNTIFSLEHFSRVYYI